MIALATTHDGDVPLFLQPLDGNSSDKVSLLAAITTIQAQLREANAVLNEGSEQWQTAEDGSTQWYSRVMTLPQGTERWLIVRTQASQQRAQVSLQRQVTTAQASWERKCWHLSNRRFACEADARA